MAGRPEKYMDLKKSIFSYIVLAAFAPLCCLSVVSALERAGVREMLGLPLAGMVGGVCVYLLFTAAVFLAFRTICTEIGRHLQNSRKAEAVLKNVLPVIVLIGVAAYLAFYLTYHTPLTLEGNSFYGQALVSDRKSVSFAVHGASWIYTHLLHVMLLVFGNTPFAGVILQIVLFFVCLLLLYIGMEAFTGMIPAVFSMAAFGFLPVSLQYVFALTPGLFFLALYLIGFALAGALYKKIIRPENSLPEGYTGHKSSARSILTAVSVFLLGLYIGVLVYLDIYGVSLYLFLAVLFSAGRNKIKRAAVWYFTAVFGGICGFFLSVMAVCLTEKMAVPAYLQELFSLYAADLRFEADIPLFMSFLPDVSVGGSMLLISFAFCMIPAFFLWERSQGSAFIVNLFLVYGLSGSSVFCPDAQMITTFAWGILAGLGVYGVVRPAEEAVVENAQEESSRGAGGSGGSEKKSADTEKSSGSGRKAGNVKDIDGSGKKAEKNVNDRMRKEEKTVSEKDDKNVTKRDTLPETAEDQMQVREEIPETAEDQMQVREKIPERAEDHKQLNKEILKQADGKQRKKEQEKPAPGEPLHNPLPVPKKKSRPQADFGYQVTDARMKFDLDVADGDDFDW